MAAIGERPGETRSAADGLPEAALYWLLWTARPKR